MDLASCFLGHSGAQKFNALVESGQGKAGPDVRPFFFLTLVVNIGRENRTELVDRGA